MLMLGLVGAVLCHISGLEQYVWVLFFIAFFISAIEFSVLAEIVNAGVATTYVCIAEDPTAIQRTRPDLAGAVTQAFPSVIWTVAQV